MATIASDLAANLVTAAVALTALGIVSLAALRGWRDWIDLKREELAARRAARRLADRDRRPQGTAAQARGDRCGGRPVKEKSSPRRRGR